MFVYFPRSPATEIHNITISWWAGACVLCPRTMPAIVEGIKNQSEGENNVINGFLKVNVSLNVFINSAGRPILGMCGMLIVYILLCASWFSNKSGAKITGQRGWSCGVSLQKLRAF